MTFTPTHFVDTDPETAKHNHVENGELLELVYAQPRSALAGTQLLDFVNADGEERSVFDTRVRELVTGETQVTCQWLSAPHNYHPDCAGQQAGFQRGWDEVRAVTSQPDPQPAAELLDVGTIVRRPDLGERALFVVEERSVDRYFTQPDPSPYRLRSLTQAVPEKWQGLLWATSNGVELEVVKPVDAAVLMLEEGREIAEQMVRDVAAALRQAAAEIEQVLS